MRTLFLAVAVASFAAAAGCGSGHRTSAPVLTRCQIVWSSPGSVSGLTDTFILDASIAEWAAGTRSVGDTAGLPSAIYYEGLDVSAGTYVARTLATAGSYSVTGTAPIGPVAVATSGGFFSGSFSGTWSAAPENPPPGTGTIQIALQGSALTLGTTVSNAICYGD